MHHITHDPPSSKDSTYENWFAIDYGMISWFVNSMDEQLSTGIMFLTPAKKIWDTLKETYGHEKNISRAYELYEQFFVLQQGD